MFTRTSKTQFGYKICLNSSFFWSLSLETREKVFKKFWLKIFRHKFFSELGVDFTFTWDNKNNHNHNNSDSPHPNFLKGAVLG